MKYKLKNYFLHYGGTTIHKFWVFWYLSKFSINLFWRSLFHDLSKYSFKESEGFLKTIDKLKYSTYGSKYYMELMDQIKPSLTHHYNKNSHHPEHYSNGIEDMSLQDIVEMFCDWQAACKRHKDGSIMKSIDYNKNRFNIPVELSEIFKSTIKKPKQCRRINKSFNVV